MANNYCLLVVVMLLSCSFQKSILAQKNGGIEPKIIRQLDLHKIKIGALITGLKYDSLEYDLKYNQYGNGYELSDKSGALTLFLLVDQDTIQEISILKDSLKQFSALPLNVGDSLASFRKLYPLIPIRYNRMYDYEFFVISGLENIGFEIVITPLQNEVLGKYKSDAFEATLDYDSTGIIESINMFRKGSKIDPEHGK